MKTVCNRAKVRGCNAQPADAPLENGENASVCHTIHRSNNAPPLALTSKCSRKPLRLGFSVYAALVLCLCCFAQPTFAAATDPLVVVANLSDFIFGLIRAIGMILLGWGIVQIGLSFQSHDPSQRSNGFLTLAGGIVITFAKEILNLIVGA